MTFCMFARASDGWVMAADRGAISEISGPMPTRTSQQITKILYDEKAGLALCFAGDMCALRVADDVLGAVNNGTFDLGNMKTELQRIANLRFASDEKATRAGVFDRMALRMIYVMSTRMASGWQVNIGEDSFAQEIGIYGSCYIGDAANPAVFWTQRYHSAYEPRLRSSQQLTFLLAYSVLEAGRVKPSMIIGLNLLSYSGGQFHWFEEPELDRLRTRSSDLASLIEEKLFAVPLDFTRSH